MSESYLKSEFTSLGGANVDAGVLRATIESNGIIVVALADGPTALRWIDEVADPTFEITFVSTLPAPQVTELDILIAAHTGPSDVSQAMRVFPKSSAPLVTDDEDKLFEVGDVWYDSSTKHAYVLTDATAGAAGWDWATGWGESRPTNLVKLRADLQTSGESAPDANQSLVTDGAGDFDLKEYGGTLDRGYFEDFGADTSTSGLAVRMSESPTFLVGRYEIGWTSQVDGSTSTVDFFPRFFFDGTLVADADVDINAATPTGFDGRIERVLTAGVKELRLEIEKTGGTGDARMRYSTMWYRYLSLS